MTNRKKSKNENPISRDFSILDINPERIEEIDRQERQSARLRHKELSEEAEQIEDLHMRLKFWRKHQKEYIFHIFGQADYMQASGVVSNSIGGQRLWLDFLIKCEIDDLLIEIQTSPTKTTPNEPPLIDVLKVVHLYELGVIEFLEKRLNTASSISLGHVVARITGGNSDTAGRYISRIKDGEKIDDNNFLVARDWILSRYGKMKPLPEIKFDKDLE
jgi:hypothetical protein